MKKYYCCLVSLLILLCSWPVYSQDEMRFSKESINPVEIEAFLDGVINTYLHDKKIPGAALSVVKDGQVIIKKGYGYADLQNRKKVNPDQTLFRIGSISKIFTWLAVFQLVEQGKLNLDADINTYLDEFKIPETYPEPVTLRSLLSHTPGFEDVLLYLFVKDSTGLMPLEQIFKDQMPRRVRPPLTHAAYSNHGTGLASYLVEKLSGMPFEEYVEANILKPLKMARTTFRQPLPRDWKQNMSKGYENEDGLLNEKSFEFIPLAGAGAASTTAGDMAQFMMALLRNTCLDDLCLMEASTYATMKTPVLYHAEGANPALHGFMDMSMNNETIVGHGGDTFWFHSVMALYPNHGLGVFLSFNSSNGGGTYMKVLEKFTDRYFPDDKLEDTIQLSSDYLNKLAGAYKMNRHPVSDFTKILSLFMGLQVSHENGRFKTQMGEEVDYWVPVSQTSFRKDNSNELLIFKLDENEVPQYLFLGNLGIIAFERMTGAYSQQLHLMILVLTIFSMFFVLIIWPLIYFFRRKPRPAEKRNSKNIPVKHKFVAAGVALFLLAFYISFALALAAGQEVVYKVPEVLKTGLVFPLIAILFLIFMIIATVKMWKAKEATLRSRLFYSFLAVAFTATVWQLYFWNLLGWNY